MFASLFTKKKNINKYEYINEHDVFRKLFSLTINHNIKIVVETIYVYYFFYKKFSQYL